MSKPKPKAEIHISQWSSSNAMRVTCISQDARAFMMTVADEFAANCYICESGALDIYIKPNYDLVDVVEYVKDEYGSVLVE